MTVTFRNTLGVGLKLQPGYLNKKKKNSKTAAVAVYDCRKSSGGSTEKLSKDRDSANLIEEHCRVTHVIVNPG